MAKLCITGITCRTTTVQLVSIALMCSVSAKVAQRCVVLIFQTDLSISLGRLVELIRAESNFSNFSNFGFNHCTETKCTIISSTMIFYWFQSNTKSVRFAYYFIFAIHPEVNCDFLKTLQSLEMIYTYVNCQRTVRARSRINDFFSVHFPTGFVCMQVCVCANVSICFSFSFVLRRQRFSFSVRPVEKLYNRRYVFFFICFCLAEDWLTLNLRRDAKSGRLHNGADGFVIWNFVQLTHVAHSPGDGS